MNKHDASIVFDLCLSRSILVGVVCYIVFFFQAEDGIRDLVRSRGLGDVYKRQVLLSWRTTASSRPIIRTRTCPPPEGCRDEHEIHGYLHQAPGAGHRSQSGDAGARAALDRTAAGAAVSPVSYTHLTLPTSDLV